MNQNPCNCGDPKREHFPVEHLTEITITKDDKMSFEPLPSQIPPQEVDVISLILPLAKGYAAEHRVGSNQKYVEIAEEYIKKAKEIPATESMEWAQDFREKFSYMRPSEGQKARGESGVLNPYDFEDIEKYITNLLAAREKEAYERGEANGFGAATKEWKEISGYNTWKDGYRMGKLEAETGGEIYKKGKENGYAESESNYHSLEDAEKKCIKQTRASVLTQVIEIVEGIDTEHTNLIDVETGKTDALYKKDVLAAVAQLSRGEGNDWETVRKI